MNINTFHTAVTTLSQLYFLNLVSKVLTLSSHQRSQHETGLCWSVVSYLYVQNVIKSAIYRFYCVHCMMVFSQHIFSSTHTIMYTDYIVKCLHTVDSNILSSFNLYFLGNLFADV